MDALALRGALTVLRALIARGPATGPLPQTIWAGHASWPGGSATPLTAAAPTGGSARTRSPCMRWPSASRPPPTPHRP
jgi:hypothetical protein